MTNLEELMIILSTSDRLEFLKFRQKYITYHGYESFQKLLKQAEKELSNEY